MKKILFYLLLMFSFSLFATPTSETSYAAADDDVIEIDVSYIPPMFLLRTSFMAIFVTKLVMAVMITAIVIKIMAMEEAMEGDLTMVSTLRAFLIRLRDQ